jgi:hypothetical protein
MVRARVSGSERFIDHLPGAEGVADRDTISGGVC